MAIAVPARLGPIIVVQDDRSDSRLLASGQFLARRAAVTMTVLETARRTMATDGGVLHVPISPDEIGAEVAAHADQRGGSLVLLASYGGGPPSGPLFDEIAEDVLQRSHRPVLVFGPHAASLTRAPTFVLASDGRCAPASVLDPLTTVVTAIGASLLVADLSATDPWPADDVDPVFDAGRHLAAAFAPRLSTRLVSRPTWDAAADLVDLVGPMTAPVLIVVAPRWPDPSNHWYGTARRLVRHAPCPVLVVPGASDQR